LKFSIASKQWLDGWFESGSPIPADQPYAIDIREIFRGYSYG
jgi:hypothetical protein